MTNAMTCQQFEELLPHLLDGSEMEMSAAARAHLDACATCRSLLADLRAIQAGAAALPTLEPGRDLWAGIAARIEAPIVPLAGDNVLRPGRRQISWRSAGIAAAILVAATTTITYRVARQAQPPATQVAAATKTVPLAADSQRTPTAPVANTAATVTRAPSPSRVVLASNAAAKVDYDREILRLRAVVDSGRTRLDPATVALLERNLSVIDSAIVQCRDALAKDPASRYLIESLNNAYQSKVKLLKIAAAASTE